MGSQLLQDHCQLGGAFARMVGRLRLTQAEIGQLLGVDELTGRLVQPVVDAATVVHVSRVLAALERVAGLVDDDAIVAEWLRTPQARWGEATPIEEVAGARGDVPVRFVLDPHPTELVGIVAARFQRSGAHPTSATPRRASATGRRASGRCEPLPEETHSASAAWAGGAG